MRVYTDIVHAVLAVILAELSVLLSLRCVVELGLRSGHIACRPARIYLLAALLIGWRLRVGSMSLTVLCTGSNRRLVHGLEGIVTGHSRVVEVLLLRLLTVGLTSTERFPR